MIKLVYVWACVYIGIYEYVYVWTCAYHINWNNQRFTKGHHEVAVICHTVRSALMNTLDSILYRSSNINTSLGVKLDVYICIYIYIYIYIYICVCVCQSTCLYIEYEWYVWYVWMNVPWTTRIQHQRMTRSQPLHGRIDMPSAHLFGMIDPLVYAWVYVWVYVCMSICISIYIPLDPSARARMAWYEEHKLSNLPLNKRSSQAPPIADGWISINWSSISTISTLGIPDALETTSMRTGWNLSSTYVCMY